MSIFKIALRSLQHRGIGSMLTIFSMALGVMLVIAVLTIYGVVERSFKSNTSFGYDLIVGARGGSSQLMLNTVFYLSSPVENIPYEYYLAFCDKDKRGKELQHSIAFSSYQTRRQLQITADEMSAIMPFGGPLDIFTELTSSTVDEAETKAMTLEDHGAIYNFTELAIPLALGDYFNEKFRVVGTTPEFFSDLVLNMETGQKFEFSSGRAFVEYSEEHGFFECVLGATVARQSNHKVGDVIYPIHGDPKKESSHIHEQGFTIVGILKSTGTANDRAAFTNLEGHFLMEDHAKPITENSILGSVDKKHSSPITPVSYVQDEIDDVQAKEAAPGEFSQELVRTRLPIEQREVTAVLVLTYYEPDESDVTTDENGSTKFVRVSLWKAISDLVGEGQLEPELNWSFYRPERAQRAAQGINPVMEVTSLFSNFISPIRWLMLLLTIMICVVSGISILVGIYNSMTQRRHELAVMRALGAGRSKVMSIMLLESMMLAISGGMLGWVAGHGLNAFVSPFVENSTGISIGFFQFAPPIEIFSWFIPKHSPIVPDYVQSFGMSQEFLLIPGLMLLAILVGIYPAISAYRTDVANSLSR